MLIEGLEKVANPGSNPGRSTNTSSYGALPSKQPLKSSQHQNNEMSDIYGYSERLGKYQTYIF
jgi:hypothetical protein